MTVNKNIDLGLISPAICNAINEWLDNESALKSSAKNTITAYEADIVRFAIFMTKHRAEPQGLSVLYLKSILEI